MPIDPSRALGAELPADDFTWDDDQVILYHLGLGCGVPCTDPKELAYTYEGSLRVLPTWGVIPVHHMMAHVLEIPGMEFNPFMLLHGEQELEVHKAIPTSATVSNIGRVAEIYDKQKAALVIFETTSKDESGDLLFTNRFSMFMRGEGGFGGPSSPKPGNESPSREPDMVVETQTFPQQALLYRLNGDKNPLHADPEFAKVAGFDQPILHGLCTYGIVCKQVVDSLLDGNTDRVAKYRVRFRGVVIPGDTIVTSMWKEDDRIIIRADNKEREHTVISNAAITLRD